MAKKNMAKKEYGKKEYGKNIMAKKSSFTTSHVKEALIFCD